MLMVQFRPLKPGENVTASAWTGRRLIARTDGLHAAVSFWNNGWVEIEGGEGRIMVVGQDWVVNRSHFMKHR
jgi:hypothetical protein